MRDLQEKELAERRLEREKHRRREEEKERHRATDDEEDFTFEPERLEAFRDRMAKLQAVSSTANEEVISAAWSKVNDIRRRIKRSKVDALKLTGSSASVQTWFRGKQ